MGVSLQMERLTSELPFDVRGRVNGVVHAIQSHADTLKDRLAIEIRKSINLEREKKEVSSVTHSHVSMDVFE